MIDYLKVFLRESHLTSFNGNRTNQHFNLLGFTKLNLFLKFRVH